MKNLYTIRKMENKTVEKINLIRTTLKIESVSKTLELIASYYIENNKTKMENEIKSQLEKLLNNEDENENKNLLKAV